MRILLSLLCLILIAAVWLWDIRSSQFAPHKITQSVNGKVLNQFWVTNNTYVKYSIERVFTNGQFSYFSVPHTNEYWHIWRCFQK